MPRVTIVCDDYKLPIFKKNLKKAGCKIEEEIIFVEDTTMLVIETDDLEALGKVVFKSEKQSQKLKRADKGTLQ